MNWSHCSHRFVVTARYSGLALDVLNLDTSDFHVSLFERKKKGMI